MTQAQLIRTLQTLTPNTDYAGLLLKEFGVEVPDAAPLYQREYLYKYCLQLSLDASVDQDTLVAMAAIKVEELMERFPWAKMKYDTVAMPTKKAKKQKQVFPDGTVRFNSATGIFEGYAQGRLVSTCKSEDKVKAFMTKKYQITEFVDVK